MITEYGEKVLVENARIDDNVNGGYIKSVIVNMSSINNKIMIIATKRYGRNVGDNILLDRFNGAYKGLCEEHYGNGFNLPRKNRIYCKGNSMIGVIKTSKFRPKAS